MSGIFRNLIFLLAIGLGLGGGMVAAQTPVGSITLSGAEQMSGAVWDTGTVTATLNGVSTSVSYGQFSTPAAVASALAAMISQTCTMPVYAQATGAVINFYARGTSMLTSGSISSTSSDPSLFPNNSFLADGSATGNPKTPNITGLSFPTGPPSMGLTITGTNFGSTQGTVMIGGKSATIISWSADGTSIKVQVPTGAGAGGVQVTPNGGSATEPFSFTVSTPFGCN